MRQESRSLDGLRSIGLDENQISHILEWYAQKIWRISEEANVYGPEWHGKSYDPLEIDLAKREVHSYVFSIHQGRHSNFESLDEIESKLDKELAERFELNQRDAIDEFNDNHIKV